MPRTRVVRTTVVRSGTSQGSHVWIWSVVIACLALLFAILSLATAGWSGRNLIKNCGTYCISTTILSFFGIFFLALGIVATILFATRLVTSFSTTIKLSAILLFAIAAIFIVSAYASYTTYNQNNYGYYLMMIAGILANISSIIVAFWLGQNWISV
jgi:hypothetical protein